MKEDTRLTIDGTEYVLKCMKTSVGSRTLLQMGKIVLPNAQALTVFDLKSEILSFMDKPFKMEDLLKAIGERLDSEEMMKIVETVLGPIVVIQGNGAVELSGIYDIHFAGKYEQLYKLFFAALKHNYASFFVGLPGIVGTLLASKTAPSSTQAPSTTTKPSGSSSSKK